MDAIMIPPLRGYMSKIVHVEDQGKLLIVVHVNTALDLCSEKDQ